MKINNNYKIIFIIINIFGNLLTSCTLRFDSSRTLIQSIKYGNKTIELYITDNGSLASPTISINISSWFNNRSSPGNTFFAGYRYGLQRMNINLDLSKEIPTLEVYYYFPREISIMRKEENIKGIKVKYIEVDENFEFSGIWPR